MFLFQLWVLTDKLLIPRLQNLVICQIEANRIRNRKFTSAMIPYVYENTSNGSPLRRFLVEFIAYHSIKSWVSIFEEDNPQEMLSELAIRLLSLRDQEKTMKAITERNKEICHTSSCLNSQYFRWEVMVEY